MRIGVGFAVVVVAGLIVTESANAQRKGTYFEGSPVRTELTPPEKAFVESYVAAITGTDINQYKRLLHPGTLACVNDANAHYFDWVFKRRIGLDVRDPFYTVQAVPANFGMFAAFESQGYRYPLKPTQAFNMNLVNGGEKEYSITAFAALDHGKWYEVLPCPPPKKTQ